jgi:S1-C subfamily serine protease
MDSEYKGQGVLLLYSFPKSPASKAGLRGGDIILQVNGQNVFSNNEVISIVQQYRIGETIRFKIEREGQKQLVDVVKGLY